MSEAPVVAVGAGLSGLAAARRAQDLGRPVVVFGKSRGLGGRLATRRADCVPVGIFLCGDVVTGVDLDAIHDSGVRAGEAASS